MAICIGKFRFSIPKYCLVSEDNKMLFRFATVDLLSYAKRL